LTLPGLDSQSAFSIVRFLRKLADVGQAVLVTIHQPSASLFYEFDTLLLLARGGKTVYNGPIGPKAATIKAYFEREGAACPPGGNIGEHMIAVVSGVLSTSRDWHQVWLDSPENKNIMDELEEIESTCRSRPVAYVDDGHEFATSTREQFSEVLKRNSVSLFRDADYLNNKFLLHITSALFNG
jgi:ATP-binding cassette subfamily G (WHITE) protein 2 (SNQ2)